MKIQSEAFVAIDYTLKDDQGNVVDKSEENSPLGFIFGRGQIIPGLEKALEGMSKDETAQVVVAPEDGYGPVNEELFQEIPKANFPNTENLEPGQQFQANTPHGPMRFVVHEIKEEDIVVNLNHPLAGQSLHFDVKVAEVREATEEELAPPVHSHCGDGSHGCCGC
ncbi:MAG: peptidylprolyl isomerase [Deltaproteobacteria bacterium]|nr:peptidylprolyl isomerase [Deltaproteobacteria bacterium]MBN2670982.1 peptidylprolyl isomerase [Deltaproteobacteria bacterium]